MDRFGSTSSLRRSFSNEPRRTLSFVDVDSDSDDQKHEHSVSQSSAYGDKHKSKTEKSVHFADEESIADDASSLTNEQVESEASEEGITWLPSEHLYSDDTFIQETETVTHKNLQDSHDPTTTIATAPSYGSSTFVPLDSDQDEEEDEEGEEAGDTNTDTEHLYSYTDSFVSSDVFTTQSGTTTYKSWKDVTEIIKDIEELQESEFVTKADSLDFDQREGEETDASESLDEEMAEAARLDFVTFALRRLRLKGLQSPKSLALDSEATSGQSQGHNIARSRVSAPQSKEEKQFCLKMIQKCKKNSNSKSEATPGSESKSVHPLYKEVPSQRDRPLEFYGVNSALVERLRLENLEASLEKKCHDLDKDISNSKSFILSVTQDTCLARDQFVTRMCSRVRRENMEDAIQAHLIKVHPVTQFAEFVKDLPPAGEDAREILYEYKRQLEHRKASGVT